MESISFKNNCPICLTADENMFTLSCKHDVHLECVGGMFQSCCPICRQEVTNWPEETSTQIECNKNKTPDVFDFGSFSYGYVDDEIWDRTRVGQMESTFERMQAHDLHWRSLISDLIIADFGFYQTVQLFGTRDREALRDAIPADYGYHHGQGLIDRLSILMARETGFDTPRGYNTPSDDSIHGEFAYRFVKVDVVYNLENVLPQTRRIFERKTSKMSQKKLPKMYKQPKRVFQRITQPRREIKQSRSRNNK